MNKNIGLGISFLFILLLGTWGRADYRPTNEAFWKEIQESTKEGNIGRVINLSMDQSKDAPKDSLMQAEGMLALSMGLEQASLNYAASIIAADLIRERQGTEVGNEAVSVLDRSVRSGLYDEEWVIQDVVNDTDFGKLPPEKQSFVSYHQGLFDLVKGYKKWSDDSFKKVLPDSFWDFKARYLTAIGEVARGRNQSALERFSGILSNELVPKEIKEQASHQHARLLFENGDYPQAYKILKTVTVVPRERGVVLMERAWAKYYEKDYSKALGLLAALEAPMYDPSRSPEPYILQMIIYKELCHYKASAETHKNFLRRFTASLNAIKKRKDLRKDPLLVNMSLLDQRLQKWANYLLKLREEEEILSTFDIESVFKGASLKSRYESKSKEVIARLNWLLFEKTRQEANDLLEWNEQMSFLDYQARLESLRVITSADDGKDYQSEEVPHLTFDKIFWTQSGEFWTDEIEDYRVIINSRCQSRRGRL